MSKENIIMIVDDSKLVCSIIKNVLDAEGYECHIANDGYEAINKYQEIHPNLILMDVEMPKMDGFAAFERIKEMPGGENIPVLFVTSVDSKAFIEKAFSNGAEDYFVKPVNIDVLRRRIKRVIENNTYKQQIIKQNNMLQNDLLEREKMEKILQEKNQELSSMLEQLKRTQSRLIQQEKMAGIGQLAAGMAHEINNPLGYVMSNFEMMDKYVVRMMTAIEHYRNFIENIPEPNAILQEKIEQISQLEQQQKINYVLEDLPQLINESKEGLSRVETIIKALRSFSRVDLMNNFEEYDINAGINTTLLVARNEMKYVAEVTTHLTEDIPAIQAIGSQINQVLLNILVNAAQALKKANMAEKGFIDVSTSYDDDFLYCSISDNGPQIPPEIQTRIFEPFFTTKPVGEGTGLGLSISYEIIVKNHNGDLNCTSNEKETTFTIVLPRKRSIT